MKQKIRVYVLLIGIALSVILLDQWTKSIVRASLPFGSSWSPWPWLDPYARIVHWNNTGAAFGIFQGFSGVFAVLAVLVSLAIVYYFHRVSNEDWLLRAALGLQLGGALGNLIDRVTQNGEVTDFISVGNFAVFNVADASITVGVLVLLLGVWLKENQDKKEMQAREAEMKTSSEMIVEHEGEQRE